MRFTFVHGFICYNSYIEYGLVPLLGGWHGTDFLCLSQRTSQGESLSPQ